MNVVVPITVTNDKVTNNTVPRIVLANNDIITYNEWNIGSTYSKNQYVQVAADGIVYRSLSNSNLGNSPTTDVSNGANGLGTHWVVWAYLETAWSSETTYSRGDFANPAGGVYTIYESIQDDNTNNPPITDVNNGDGITGTYWRIYQPAEFNSATTYAAGDIVARSHTNLVYQALQSTSTVPEDDVATGSNGVGTFWQELYPINQSAMFDDVNGTASSSYLNGTFRVSPKEIVSSVAAFNMGNIATVNIKMVDPIAGEEYNVSLSMEDDSEVTDWYQYYYADVRQIREFVVADLPSYPNAYIEVTVAVSTGTNYQGVWANQSGAVSGSGGYSVEHKGNIWSAANYQAATWASLTGAATVPYSVEHSGSVWFLTTNIADVTASEPSGGNSDWILASLAEPSDISDYWTLTGGAYASLGTLIFGRVFELGVSEYGSSIQLLDFSRKDTDSFGNFVITERRNSKLVDFEGYVEFERTSYLFQKLRELTTIPCVWYATGTLPTQDPTIVYGYYRDSRINISNPATSDVTIQIEGLI